MASVPEARMHPREAEYRAIATAFLASVGLHLLLLLAWPTLRDPAKRAEFSPGPIIARLMAPAPTVPVHAPAAPRTAPAGGPSASKPEATVPPKPEPSRSAIAEPARKAQPKPETTAKAEILASEKLEAPVAPKPERPQPRTESDNAAVSPPPLSPPVTGQAPPPHAGPAQSESTSRAALAPSVRDAMRPPSQAVTPPQAPDASTLAQYRLAVIDAARRHKRYPRVALDNNWEGRVDVRMVIGASGAIASLEVRASAGHEVLDREALDMIRQAKPQTPIPGALRGREFDIEIPVIFSLREPGA